MKNPCLILAGLISLIVSSRAADPAPLRLSAPLDLEVFQRDITTGVIRVAGSLVAPRQAAGVVEGRIDGVDPAGTWRDLGPVGPGQTEFRAGMTAPAGGWYRVQVRMTENGSVVAAAEVARVGVGEIFVIAGQSNSANHGEERQTTRTGRVAAFDGTKWQLANDPQPGASGDGGSFMPAFGDGMAERFHVPVGVVATGVGATSVREWLPRGTRFPNPPTLTGHVTRLASGDWECDGVLFAQFTARVKSLGAHGFRAVLWHQGESDAHQQDPPRTLPGELYRTYMEHLIRESRREAGWEHPWFVAQASYHTPDDPASPDIRAAQKALWDSGVALPGPDTDALTGAFRDGGGRGVHFSGPGLREHAAQWVEKIAPWLEARLKASVPRAGAPGRLVLPASESITVAGRPAFVFLPPAGSRPQPQPWIFYAPTLPAYPDEAERWMHEQFLAAGIAVAGVDVGEAYGSPKSHAAFDALHRELVGNRGFAAKPCLFGRSRGGLWVSSWAIAHPERVAGLIGIYPVFDLRSYPGLDAAAPAYDLTPDQLRARLAEFNPVDRLEQLAKAGIPAALIHGDVDTVVPMEQNSAEFVRRYAAAGAGSLVTLHRIEGQGHNFFDGYFHSQALVDFAIAAARDGARP